MVKQVVEVKKIGSRISNRHDRNYNVKIRNIKIKQLKDVYDFEKVKVRQNNQFIRAMALTR